MRILPIKSCHLTRSSTGGCTLLEFMRLPTCMYPLGFGPTAELLYFCSLLWHFHSNYLFFLRRALEVGDSCHHCHLKGEVTAFQKDQCFVPGTALEQSWLKPTQKLGFLTLRTLSPPLPFDQKQMSLLGFCLLALSLRKQRNGAEMPSSWHLWRSAQLRPCKGQGGA